ncbi:glycosyltransferase [Stappia sp. F7233]|uniref:Glycosyltransferase n=1 Tax=Stappia albiluteola TaxID=2758565 RepID=A0A839ABQ8_9HYPH|nr:glycosyltransferase [Stappia albiluteola]MBA5777130.1 glycosyltransferase [Stappia albiluteola]
MNGNAPKVLLLSGFHPSAEAVSSGPKIVARVIRDLEAKGREVVTVSFENELDRVHHAEGFRPAGAEGSRVFRLTTARRILAALRHPLLPFAASARPFVARRYVEALLNGDAFEAIEVEFIQAIEALPESAWKDARLVSHDVLTQLYARRLAHAHGLKRIAAWLEYQRVKRWERRVFRKVGRIVALNAKDKALIEEISGRSDVAVRYPEIRAYINPKERTAETVEPGTLLYWGHMGRAENADAVLYFVAEILPLIRRQRPDTRLIVAGIDPPEEIRRLQGPGIEVTGFVADPAPLFRRAEIGIVPLRLGAGIKIKTLELLASGLPVVATTVGAEGVEASPLLRVADRPADFAGAVLGLMAAKAEM